MPTNAKASPQAKQLMLFQPPGPGHLWEAMPSECRRQIEQLLARTLREYAACQRGQALDRGARDG